MTDDTTRGLNGSARPRRIDRPLADGGTDDIDYWRAEIAALLDIPPTP